ncbi:type II toxin-antitoxin system VapC family toxin [Methylobacterium goesingense]|uniref:type II toxin-antitoxin system VapC family toxin n=1 Tax=Methylobacterium goesingense TaxID=243690 RepID=UPI00279572F4|nr:type II toxin-antitoxin system VapC family toxin [Methylobacterium goesingense]
MTIFVDASALIAIITGEPEADALSDRLEADADRLCSTLSVWETVAGLVRSYAFTVEAARAQVRLYLDAGAIRFVPLGEAESDLAIAAYDRFGKGRHPAALNMGDCHAYACARAHGAALLYKGDDFARTDLAHPPGIGP